MGKTKQDYSSKGVTALYQLVEYTLSLIYFMFWNLCLLLKAARLYVFAQQMKHYKEIRLILVFVLHPHMYFHYRMKISFLKCMVYI